MLFRQPRKIERWLTHTISWALFLTLSFALLVGSLTRLASLGLAVAKIQHDLRNILSSAQIASDRLAVIDDPVLRVSRF